MFKKKNSSRQSPLFSTYSSSSSSRRDIIGSVDKYSPKTRTTILKKPSKFREEFNHKTENLKSKVISRISRCSIDKDASSPFGGSFGKDSNLPEMRLSKALSIQNRLKEELTHCKKGACENPSDDFNRVNVRKTAPNINKFLKQNMSSSLMVFKNEMKDDFLFKSNETIDLNNENSDLLNSNFNALQVQVNESNESESELSDISSEKGTSKKERGYYTDSYIIGSKNIEKISKYYLILIMIL